MPSLSSNLKSLMELAKINASELARRTGVAQPIIHRLSTGQNTNPKLATVKPISEYFMITVSQLIGEDTLPTDKSLYRVSQEHRGWTRVMLISWQDASNWPANLQKYQDAEDSVYISTDAKVSATSYGLKISGSAMEPIFPDGTRIIVDPQRTPIDRDFVVAHLEGDTTVRLKQLIIDGSDFYLKSINPDIEDIKISRIKQPNVILGVMAQAKMDF